MTGKTRPINIILLYCNMPGKNANAKMKLLELKHFKMKFTKILTMNKLSDNI